MNKIAVPLLVAALAGEAVMIAALSRKIDRLQQELHRVEAKSKDTAQRGRVQELEEKIARIEERGSRLPSRADAERTTGSAALAAEAVPMTEEQVTQLVERKVQEKIDQMPKDNGWGGKKLPLQTIAANLQLDAATQAAMAEKINEAKQEAFDLLKLTRTDGSNLVDELVTAMTSGENAQEATSKVFMKLFTEKIPGRDETYFAGILKIQESAHQELKKVLTPDLYMKYKHTAVEPLDVETGFDPWAEYLKQKGVTPP
jgi:polyhydroxyalkanoate synthesis regulator phasin